MAFTVLSGTQGFPLQSLLGAGDAVVPSSSGAARVSGPAPSVPADAFLRGGGVTPAGTAAGTEAGGGPTAATELSGGTRQGSGDSGGDSSSGVGASGVTAPSGAPPSSAPGSGSGLPGAPTVTPEPPPAVQQLGGAVSGLPPAVSEEANDAAAGADAALGGGLSQSGARQTVQLSTAALLAPQSAVGQAAQGIGGALQGQSAGQAG